MLSVEASEGREQQCEDHPVKLQIDSGLQSHWEELDEGSKQNDGRQGFEVVVGEPQLSLVAHVFGTEQVGVDETWIMGCVPEAITKMPESM